MDPEVSALIDTIETSGPREKLVALEASWADEEHGFYLDLHAYFAEPSFAHPTLRRKLLRSEWVGPWTSAPMDQLWPIAEMLFVLYREAAGGTPLHLPSEPVPDDDHHTWWAMDTEPLPERAWNVRWRVEDHAVDACRNERGESVVAGRVPEDVIAPVLRQIDGHPAGADVLERHVHFAVDVDGTVVETVRVFTIRARVPPAVVELFGRYDRGEVGFTDALVELRDAHGLDPHDLPLLVLQAFDADMSDGRVYIPVKEWACDEPHRLDLDAHFSGKLRLRPGFVAD